jgi:hypothetical protein
MWCSDVRCNDVRCRRGIAAIALSVVVAGVSAPARAEEPTDGPGRNVTLAERRAAEAFEAYSKGEYPNAVTLYLEAYGASASAAILYNLARIYDTKLDDRAQAIAFYRRYIASVDARPDLSRTARLRLEELETADASPGSGRSVDLNPGTPRATKRGGEPVAPPIAPGPESRPGWSTQRWAGVVLGTTGLVGLAVGGAFGLAARSNANTAHQLCDGNVCTSQKGVDASRIGLRDATISNIGFGAGAALLLTGAILFVTGAEGKAESEGGPNVRLDARADASAWTLQLAGRW